jgi:hypothetical protein
VPGRVNQEKNRTNRAEIQGPALREPMMLSKKNQRGK